ncbi:MAG TPA: YceI family protein [Longimicrobiales bacterium]
MSATQNAIGTTTTWRLDPDHTQVGFAVRHMMFATVKGQFGTVSGELRLNEQDPAASAINVKIEAASIDTRSEQRDAHLRSGDFLDAENHPQLTFVARGIQPIGGTRFRITGDLTIRGVTREVVLDAEENGRGKDPWGQEKLGFTATTSIDRKDFGLTWNQALEAGGVLVSDEVKIHIDGQAIRA